MKLCIALKLLYLQHVNINTINTVYIITKRQLTVYFYFYVFQFYSMKTNSWLQSRNALSITERYRENVYKGSLGKVNRLCNLLKDESIKELNPSHILKIPYPVFDKIISKNT